MTTVGIRARAEGMSLLLDGDAPARTGADHVALALVERLGAAGSALREAVDPAPEFRAVLRRRLVAVAAVQDPAPAPVPREGGEHAARAGRRGLVPAAAATAALIMASGVAVASSRSLPGDPFYGAKRVAEDLQLHTADGDIGKGRRQLQFASTRLDEVRDLALGPRSLSLEGGSALGAPSALGGSALVDSALVDTGEGPDRSRRIQQTLADMDAASKHGSRLLLDAWKATRRTEPLALLSTWAGEQSTGIDEVLPALSGADADRAKGSLALVQGLGQQADHVLAVPACAGGSCDPSSVPPAVPPAVAPSTSGTPGSSGSPTVPAASATPTPGTQASGGSPSPAPTDSGGSAGPGGSPGPGGSGLPGPTGSPDTASASPDPSTARSQEPSSAPTATADPEPTLPVPSPTLPLPSVFPSLTSPPSPTPLETGPVPSPTDLVVLATPSPSPLPSLSPPPPPASDLPSPLPTLPPSEAAPSSESPIPSG